MGDELHTVYSRAHAPNGRVVYLPSYFTATSVDGKLLELRLAGAARDFAGSDPATLLLLPQNRMSYRQRREAPS